MIAVVCFINLEINWYRFEGIFNIQAKGINWGVTVITFAVLAPIASGEIGFKDLS